MDSKNKAQQKQPGNQVLKTKSHKILEVMKKLGIKDYNIFGAPWMEFYYPGTIWEGQTGSISFCLKDGVDNPVETINKSNSSVVISDIDDGISLLDLSSKAIVVVNNPRGVFIKILNSVIPPERKCSEIHPTAVIDKEAKIHPTSYIGPYCVIGKAKIGRNSLLFSNVTINDNVVIGDEVTINPGSVIGYDGFGYELNENGELEKFPHYGGVIIEDKVEIGSNVSIDRGVLRNTIIRRGAKIDNFSHIAHNVVIGEHCLIIAHAMIGGSTVIGAHTTVAPSATVRDRITIGKNSLIGMGAVVTKDIEENATVVGSPAIPLEQMKRIRKILNKLQLEDGHDKSGVQN